MSHRDQKPRILSGVGEPGGTPASQGSIYLQGVESEPFLEELQDESDRAAAVLAAAWLDTRLEGLLEATLLQCGGITKGLFESLGPLGSFSGKISMCAALGLLTTMEGRDLHRLRKIRNDFAHRPESLSFQTDPIRARTFEFELVTGFVARLEDDPYQHPRVRFNVEVVLLGVGLTKRIGETRRYPEPELWLPEVSGSRGA